ncbi:MAG: hypothetical protein JNM18_06925 [Planctomycetaceae bacterium]|nr:hypothetical protein [Planctomycetaceae bacterium]
MIVRWALIAASDRCADWQRIAPRVGHAPLAITVERVADLAGHLDKCDAIVHDSGEPPTIAEWQQLLGYGKHCLIASPPPIAPTDLAQATEHFRERGLRLLCLGGARSLPSNRSVHDVVASGKLGIPGLVRTHRWLPACGGSLLQMLHADVDLACWIMGARPTTVFARGVPSSDRAATWDYLQLHLGFVGDAMAMLDVSRRLPNGDDYYSLSVIGSAGAAYADDHHNQQLLYTGGHPQALRTEQGDRQRLARLEHFLLTIANPTAYMADVLDGRRTLDVLAATSESLTIDRAVHLSREQDSVEVTR